jgi:hypothetical protein
MARAAVVCFNSMDVGSGWTRVHATNQPPLYMARRRGTQPNNGEEYKLRSHALRVSLPPSLYYSVASERSGSFIRVSVVHPSLSLEFDRSIGHGDDRRGAAPRSARRARRRRHGCAAGEEAVVVGGQERGVWDGRPRRRTGIQVSAIYMSLHAGYDRPFLEVKM